MVLTAYNLLFVLHATAFFPFELDCDNAIVLQYKAIAKLERYIPLNVSVPREVSAFLSCTEIDRFLLVVFLAASFIAKNTSFTFCAHILMTETKKSYEYYTLQCCHK